MLEEKGVLDKPQIVREEMVRTEPKKGKGWILKLILILLVIGLVLYLFLNPEGIRNFVNNFFENLLS